MNNNRFAILWAIVVMGCTAGFLACGDDTNPTSDISAGDVDLCNGGAPNACGGCGPLIGTPGSPCTNCGSWACDSLTTVTCVPPVNVPGSECTSGGCFGTYICGGDGLVACTASPANACGLCDGPAVSGLGAACNGPGGCQGTAICSADRSEAVCDAPAPNECGVCGGAPVDGVGDACTNADGCEGFTVCDTTGSAVTCDAPARNACGVCAPPVAGLNETCTASGGCTGVTGCDSTGTTTVCLAAGTNSCGVCGAPEPVGLGQPCTTVTGCDGVFVCDQAGTGLTCNASEINACGVCRGPVVTGIGNACFNGRGCPGTYACNSNGDGAVCNAAACAVKGLLFSEVSGANISSDPAVPIANTDEFIELYNASAQTLDIGGVTVWARNATTTNAPVALVTFPSGTTVPPHRYVLLGKRAGLGGSSGYVGPPAADFIFSAVDLSYSSASGNQIWLTLTAIPPSNPGDAGVIDMLGWGTANVSEGGSPGPAHPPLGGSIERKARENSTGWDGGTNNGSMGPGGADANAGNGHDSNRNGLDFVTRQVRQPQNSLSPAERP